MPDVEFTNLFAILLIGLIAPVVLGLAPRLRVPSVVLEVALGVLVGPSVLGWVEIDLPVQILALVGLAFLLFSAGLEIDLPRLRGRVLRLALLGYVVTSAVGMAAGLGFAGLGWVDSPLLLVVTLSATSLGLVVPVLKDAGRVDGVVGQTTIAASTVADVAAVLAVSLLFSSSSSSAGSRVVLLVMFTLLVASTGLVVVLAERSRRLAQVVLRLQDTTAAIRVRGAVVLLIGFVAMAERFGLESILGAFLAGAVVSALDRNTATHPHFRVQLEAIGYGFAIPVFFVTSGMRLDLAGLGRPDALAMVPLFLVALLAARATPALLYLPELGPRASAAAGLLQATSLPFIVTATQIGTGLGLLDEVTASALVCAGLVSVLVFPAGALALLRQDSRPDGTPAASTARSPRAAPNPDRPHSPPSKAPQLHHR